MIVNPSEGAIGKIRLLVAHEWRSPRTGMTDYLAHLWPDRTIEAVPPEDLPTGADDLADAVVLCDAPTPAVQAHARGWLALPYDGPTVAVAGVGEAFHAFSSEDFDAVLAVLDDLMAGRWTPPDRAPQPQ